MISDGVKMSDEKRYILITEGEFLVQSSQVKHCFVCFLEGCDGRLSGTSLSLDFLEIKFDQISFSLIKIKKKPFLISKQSSMDRDVSGIVYR